MLESNPDTECIELYNFSLQFQAYQSNEVEYVHAEQTRWMKVNK